MGSQIITAPEYGPILGHDLITGQVNTGYWVDQIASVGLGTATAKTKLGGTQVQGTSADYLIPTAAKCIVAVRPKLFLLGVATANQSVVATLKIESGDLGVKDYEVLANPLESGLGTNEMQAQDVSPWYPWMQPCNGGEKVQFFGTPQIANAVQPFMSVDVLLSNLWPEGYDTGKWRPGYNPIQAKVAGINYGGGPTALGTTAGSVATDGGVTISGPKKRLVGIYNIAVDTTPAAGKGLAGQLQVSASEITINPQRLNVEPITGFLGTTTTGGLAHITKQLLNLGWNTPSTPKSSITLDGAVTNAGNFVTGYAYMDDNR